MPRLDFEVLIDKRENKKQCTIHPLRERPDFHLRYFDTGTELLPPLAGDVLLHVDGEPLDEFARRRPEVGRIATIDCTWKRLGPVLKRLPLPLPALVKIPASFVTAYPRRSKIPGLDPDGGLATIEALFIAAAFFGVWDETLLEKFHFKKEFLALNSKNWNRYQLGPAQVREK